MGVILAMGIFWTLYGLAGIFGFQVINDRYRNHDWTKEYIRFRGISWLMMGVPFIILYLLTFDKNIDKNVLCLLALACGTPSIVYSFVKERKYKRLLKDKG